MTVIRLARPPEIVSNANELGYNWGFFTMLGYVPFPMGLSIYGSVFYLGAMLVRVRDRHPLATGYKLLSRADEALAAGKVAHAGEADLDAAELEEVLEDGTGEAGARQRAEVPPPAR